MIFTVDNNGNSHSVNLGLPLRCLLNGDEDDIGNKVFSYYSNSKNIASDYDFFYENYEFSIKLISKILNSYDDIEASDDYSRILTGPWALTFTMIVIERYQSILELIGHNCIKIQDEIKITEYVIENAGDLFKESQSDKFNNLIIFQILSAIQKYRNNENKPVIRCRLQENNFVMEPQNTVSKRINSKSKFHIRISDYIKYRMTQFAEHIMCLRLNNKSRVLFLLPEFGIKDLIRIFLKQRSAFKILHSLKTSKFNNTSFSREYSKDFLKSEKNELYCVIQELIIKNLPKEFLEYFNHNKNTALKLVKNDFSRLVTRSPTDTNPIVRHIMAHSFDLKIPHTSMQHGGGYNNYENHPLDLLERSFVDNYLVWGNISIKPSKVVGITKTSWFNLFSNNYYNSNGNLLIISPPLRRYYAGDFSYPTSFVFAYQKYMFKFINYFNNTIHKKIVYRMGWDFGVAEAEWVKGIASEITISTRENVSHAFKLVINSRLVVCTYNSSMWLELSQLNHPFILVLDKRYDLCTSLNENVFSEMEENNMLFYNSEDAAIHVSSCFNDPYHWWNTKKVQSTRLLITKAFCDSFNPLEFAKSI